MKNLSFILIALQITQTPLVLAAETAAGGVAETLNSVNSALSTGSQAMGAIQFSQTQMQAMVNQFAGLNAQMQGQQQQMSTFQQVGGMIEQARVAAADCVNKAQAKVDHLKKATIKPTDLTNATVTCSNYGNVLDSIKKNEAELNAVDAKMKCIYEFQNNVNQIAERSKAVFNQLTQSAQKVWNTHDTIIKAQESIVKKIDSELNDKDNGYKVRLAKLRETETKIRNALNAGSGTGKDGETGGGILSRIRNIKQQRNATASAWYFNLMGETEACFANSPMPCDTLGNLASTRQCISAYLGQGQSGGPASKVVANVNNQRLATAFDTIRESVRTTDMVLENVDIKSPNEFLIHANKRFNNKMVAISRSISRMKTIGGVNNNALAAIARRNYEACYKEKVAEFKGDIESSSGGKYRQGINAMVEQESALSNEIKNLAEEAQREMTSFKKAFNKTYSRDLPQFTSDCTKENDPYSSADCLKKVQLMLKAGLDGTIEGGQYQIPYVPEPTTMNLQSISNQNGQVLVTSKAMTCVGFEECLTTMENYMAGHQSQMDGQKREREQFVKSHNETLAASMAGISQVFAQAGEVFTNAAGSINKELADGGVVGAAVTVKQIKGEPLALDDKMEEPKLYGLPKDMKAALAGMGQYSEINGDKVTGPLNSRKEKLKELGDEAKKKKGQCKVFKSDIEEVMGRLECDSDNICQSDNLEATLRPFEKLLRKSQAEGDDGTKSSSFSEDYQNCTEKAEDSQDLKNLEYFETASDSEKSEDSTGKKKYTGSSDLLREKIRQAKEKGERKAARCRKNLVADVDALKPRESMKPIINDIKAKVMKMERSCPSNPDQAMSVCNSLKSSLKKATPPNEDESPDSATAPSNGTSYTNPLDTTIKSAQ